jgi:hypothetical protein
MGCEAQTAAIAAAMAIPVKRLDETKMMRQKGRGKGLEWAGNVGKSSAYGTYPQD